jgi:hypothetical protein
MALAFSGFARMHRVVERIEAQMTVLTERREIFDPNIVLIVFVAAQWAIVRTTFEPVSGWASPFFAPQHSHLESARRRVPCLIRDQLEG